MTSIVLSRCDSSSPSVLIHQWFLSPPVWLSEVKVPVTSAVLTSMLIGLCHVTETPYFIGKMRTRQTRPLKGFVNMNVEMNVDVSNLLVRRSGAGVSRALGFHFFIFMSWSLQLFSRCFLCRSSFCCFTAFFSSCWALKWSWRRGAERGLVMMHFNLQHCSNIKMFSMFWTLLEWLFFLMNFLYSGFQLLAQYEVTNLSFSALQILQQ